MYIKVVNGEQIELEEGSTARDLALKLNLNTPDQALAANINGTTCDLSTLLTPDDEVEFICFEQPLGKEIFWHTSAHVLAQAILRLYPQALPTIGPPIENGFYYDFANLTISEEDFPAIEKEMQKICKENYLSKRVNFSSKAEALQEFSHNPYKVEIIESIEEGSSLSGYRQGEFFDLCRGPHLPSLGKIKAIKLTKTSGAYWRGDSTKEMLTRIYGISFPDKEQLKQYLERLEEAKKRDHKILGPQLNLFSFKEEAPGMPFIHPIGMRIWNTLTRYIVDLMEKEGYVEIKTPVLLSRELWERSGHWQNYKENMFDSIVEKREYAIKPMNCPGGMLFFKGRPHSYRDLPYRVAEIGNVHRYEASGALSGLFRCRSFHQDDAHIFMKPSDIKEEILNVLRFADHLYSLFDLSYHLELSTRPESGTIGTDRDWEIATEGLRSALESSGKGYKINEGDGAFYGPKIDFHIKDALGRTWQCGTVQLDMALPERFDLEYTDQDGSKKRPIMIHRAICGSIERFFGILIEHFAGKFPLWLSPRQIRVFTVADRHKEFAEEVTNALKQEGFYADCDSSSESVAKKVRLAQLDKVNYMITIGDKEVQSRQLALRTREGKVVNELSLTDFIEAIKREKESKSLIAAY
jgi:threonyl-tRNA synthetase